MAQPVRGSWDFIAVPVLKGLRGSGEGTEMRGTMSTDRRPRSAGARGHRECCQDATAPRGAAACAWRLGVRGPLVRMGGNCTGREEAPCAWGQVEEAGRGRAHLSGPQSAWSRGGCGEQGQVGFGPRMEPCPGWVASKATFCS